MVQLQAIILLAGDTALHVMCSEFTHTSLSWCMPNLFGDLYTVYPTPALDKWQIDLTDSLVTYKTLAQIVHDDCRSIHQLENS
jgi:hypothetical protein